MLILDTNIISELMRPTVSTAVETWCESQPRATLYITTITQAEILYGIAILPAGARKKRLQELVEELFQEDFAGRILPFDSESAQNYAALNASRRSQGNPIAQFDAQIAAICWTNEAAIVTRNVNDFANCNLEIINPWDL
ncbi:MAG: type II toxin-antitoxin system VapC family toxin [Cyanobacteria bacterium P01_E01_bin.6]